MNTLKNIEIHNPDLSDWEIEILRTGTPRIGEGNIVFTRIDGVKVTVFNARVDSVGPSAEAPGVVGVEFFSTDAVVHVPFVATWTVEYVL